jgi:cardiolipin synthase A/B
VAPIPIQEDGSPFASVTHPRLGTSRHPRPQPWDMLLPILILAHALGLATSVAALMSTRTAQGTVAWLLALNTLPYVAVPVYWVLGRRRFQGYLVARRDEDAKLRTVLGEKMAWVGPFRFALEDDRGGGLRAMETLAALPALRGNEVELLVDGQAIFRSMFEGIAGAREYLLVQFYIVKDDGIGRELKNRLIERARDGIRVRFLYDEVGSYGLPDRYTRDLEDAGVEVSAFHSTQGRGNRFQLNFRNHRKVLVADGKEGWLGGINLGDEYLGRDPELGHLRETHLRIQGPAALGLQLSFLEDWRWATNEVPDLSWEPHPAPEGRDLPVLIIPSGPADPMETGSLMVQHAAHSAHDRLWISTPYFVPDGGVMAALRLAALRGVDVRILIPERPDHLTVGLAGYSFMSQLAGSGVTFLRYRKGFLHGKSILFDRVAASVGTMNLDNRSFRLNFEVTALVMDEGFAGEVEAMFLRDFAESVEVTEEEVRRAPFRKRAAARAAALLAPIL